jgi:hypothetical protein
VAEFQHRRGAEDVRRKGECNAESSPRLLKMTPRLYQRSHTSCSFLLLERVQRLFCLLLSAWKIQKVSTLFFIPRESLNKPHDPGKEKAGCFLG